MDGWKTILSFWGVGWPIFRGENAVSFREGRLVKIIQLKPFVRKGSERSWSYFPPNIEDITGEANPTSFTMISVGLPPGPQDAGSSQMSGFSLGFRSLKIRNIPGGDWNPGWGG